MNWNTQEKAKPQRAERLLTLDVLGAPTTFAYEADGDPPVTILVGQSGSLMASYVKDGRQRVLETFDAVITRAFVDMVKRAIVVGIGHERADHATADKILERFSKTDNGALQRGPWFHGGHGT